MFQRIAPATQIVLLITNNEQNTNEKNDMKCDHFLKQGRELENE